MLVPVAGDASRVVSAEGKEALDPRRNAASAGAVATLPKSTPAVAEIFRQNVAQLIVGVNGNVPVHGAECWCWTLGSVPLNDRLTGTVFEALSASGSMAPPSFFQCVQGRTLLKDEIFASGQVHVCGT